MSDSVWPHRQQPTRLPHPWDSPGKNTGVGCHFLLQCMKVKNESEVAQSCPTLSDPKDCSLPGSSVHGIFQARVLEWGAIAIIIKGTEIILLKLYKLNIDGNEYKDCLFRSFFLITFKIPWMMTVNCLWENLLGKSVSVKNLFGLW